MPNPNPKLSPQNLRASHPGNVNAGKHGIFSQKMRARRAHEVADALMALPHVAPVDIVAASVTGDLFALHEALSGELTKCLQRLVSDDTDDHAAAVARLVRLGELENRTANRLLEALDRFGATPQSRARWRREMAAGETLAESARRLREDNDKGGA